MANSTNSTSDPSDPLDAGHIFKWAMGAFIAAYGVKKVGDALTDHKRKDTALIDFDAQNLSLWVKNRLKDAYRAHDFYVTKFPDTPPAIFPKAVRILYDLIQFHGRGRRDDWLGHTILRECEELHRIAVRLKYAPISQPWEYWRLVGRKIKIRNVWGVEQEKIEFVPNPNWNLERFLNEDYNGLIKFGLFGTKDKRIDIIIYEKDWFGNLKNGIKLDLSKYNIGYIYDKAWNGREVVVIYDIKWTEFQELIKIIEDRNFELILRNWGFGTINYSNEAKRNILWGSAKLTIQNKNGFNVEISSVGQLKGGKIGCSYASILCAIHILLCIDKKNFNTDIIQNIIQKLDIKKDFQLLLNSPQSLYNYYLDHLSLSTQEDISTILPTKIINPNDISRILKKSPIIASLIEFRDKNDLGHTILLISQYIYQNELWIVAMDPDAENKYKTGRFCLIKFNYIISHWWYGNSIKNIYN